MRADPNEPKTPEGPSDDDLLADLDRIFRKEEKGR